jgi:hypothetical protein
MGYYVRVLSTSPKCVPLETLQGAIVCSKLGATIVAENSTPSEWSELVLKHQDGTEIAAIERNLVEPKTLGEEELSEFADEMENGLPSNAATWLINYFKKVKCIYAFQVLSGSSKDNGWEILGVVKNAIWNFAPSIMQADLEGFSNEDGYHIVWQFRDSVKGSWWMSVINGSHWLNFQMDLANPSHREAFKQGKVPEGLTASKGGPI